jgi:hypothetical protein
MAPERGGDACAHDCVVVCAACVGSCSLPDNGIGDEGAAAIGAGLAHLPQLQTLEYAVCPVVSARSWYVLARGRGAMACVCAVAVWGACLSCSLGCNSIDTAGVAAAAVRTLMRAATGRRLDGFVYGIGVTTEEEDREASSCYCSCEVLKGNGGASRSPRSPLFSCARRPGPSCVHGADAMSLCVTQLRVVFVPCVHVERQNAGRWCQWVGGGWVGVQGHGVAASLPCWAALCTQFPASGTVPMSFRGATRGRVLCATLDAHCAAWMLQSHLQPARRDCGASLLVLACCCGCPACRLLQAAQRARRWSPLRAAWLGALSCTFPGVKAGRVGREPMPTQGLHAGGGRDSGSGSSRVSDAGAEERRTCQQVEPGLAGLPPGHNVASAPAPPGPTDRV